MCPTRATHLRNLLFHMISIVHYAVLTCLLCSDTSCFTFLRCFQTWWSHRLRGAGQAGCGTGAARATEGDREIVGVSYVTFLVPVGVEAVVVALATGVEYGELVMARRDKLEAIKEGDLEEEEDEAEDLGASHVMTGCRCILALGKEGRSQNPRE